LLERLSKKVGQNVLHGHPAVAALKHPHLLDVVRGQIAVLHGRRAVADFMSFAPKDRVHPMTAILDGFYKQGHIELVQAPHDLPDGRVRIILIPQDHLKVPPRYLVFGKYQTGRMSTLEDFQEAEWHGDAEIDQQHGQ